MDLTVELPLIASEAQMRCLFEERWARWHRARSFEEAVKDPLTKKLLILAVAHMASHAPQQRVRGRQAIACAAPAAQMSLA